MKCPVCDAEVDDITPRTFDGKSFRCSTCGEYDIAGTVFDAGMLARLQLEERTAALDKAKRFAKQGKRPMITSYVL